MIKVCLGSFGWIFTRECKQKNCLSLSLSLSFSVSVATLLMRSSLRHVRLWQTLLPYRKHSKQPHDTSNVSCRKTGKHFLVNHHNKYKLTRNATLSCTYHFCTVLPSRLFGSILSVALIFGWFCVHIFSVKVWWLCQVITRSIHPSLYPCVPRSWVRFPMNGCMNWENTHWIQCRFG